MSEDSTQRNERLEGYFKKYDERLLQYAIGETGGDEELAEELVQETWAKAVISLEQIRSEEDESVFAWLRRTLRNARIDLFRKRFARKEVPWQHDDDPGLATSPSFLSRLLEADLARLESWLIARMPPELQSVATAIAQHGKQYETLAEVLDSTPHRVRSLVQRLKRWVVFYYNAQLNVQVSEQRQMLSEVSRFWFDWTTHFVAETLTRKEEGDL